MIPKVIHYCWFGRNPLPESAVRCMESWRRFMPDYEYVRWNEDNFDVNAMPYTQEAYAAGKFAFVSDVVRLKALKERGGIYLDVDFEVFKSFDDLLHNTAFAGFEGSKSNPVMMGVLGSVAEGQWVSHQLKRYEDQHFLVDGVSDLTTNVRFITDDMVAGGFVPDGHEQDYMDLHVYPVDYFCPRLTTGEYRRTENTHCEPVEAVSSWAESTLKDRLFRLMPSGMKVFLIKTKRKLFG